MGTKLIDKEKKMMRVMLLSLAVFSMLSIFPLAVYSTDDDHHSEEKKKEKKEEPPKMGNFALPSPQQPGPLLSFGQHVINEDQAQLFVFADYFGAPHKRQFDIIPSFLYGLTDDFSIYLNLPIAASLKDGKNHSSGWEDMFLQLEYAYYDNKTTNYSEQGTVVTSFNFPTGSTKKQPTRGFGSPSFFVGTTFSRTYTDWLAFASPGVLFTTSYEGTKLGNVFFYQAGFGRNILGIPDELVLTWMVEMEGQYVDKSKIHSRTDPNSGGNTIFITPSLWISTKKLIIQLGVGLPAAQHLFGSQRKSRYLLSANFGWTF